MVFLYLQPLFETKIVTFLNFSYLYYYIIMQNVQPLLENVFQDKIIGYNQDLEAKEYFGCNFEIKKLSIKYRKAKITPKKVGCFVAIWKRDSDGKTIPFHISDSFDFYLIEVEDSENKGIFIFPKSILEKNKILSSDKEGKRGFRLYPSWCEHLNNQAQKTQNWQLPYFVDLNQTEILTINQFKKIFKL